MDKETVAKIQQDLKALKSNKYIQGKYGLTIGQVAGIRHRMKEAGLIEGAKRKERDTRADLPAVPVKVQAPKPQPIAIRMRTKRDPSIFDTPPKEEGPKLNCTILELKVHQCRWVLEDVNYTFCGQPKVKGSYCLVHSKLVYTAPPARRGGVPRPFMRRGSR